jgi:glutamyl-tRNA reductase
MIAACGAGVRRGMESIGILGLWVRDHGAAALAPFTVERKHRVRRTAELAAALGVDELVYLATCNRVEVVYRASAGRDLREPLLRALLGREPRPDEAARSFRAWSGDGAVRHLFEVAAGLDSAQLGEREIRGQVRDALADARLAGTSGGLLDQLMEEALRVARRVHLRTQLGAGKVSLADIAAELLLERVRRTPSPVALVGVSAMTRRCAEILARARVPFVVVNRTVARAEALAATHHAASAMALDEFRLEPPRVEAVLCATGAPVAVLDRAALERLAAHTASQEPPLVVDLALPPDVDPETARETQVQRVGMDEINGAAERQHSSRRAQATAAHALVDEALGGLKRRLAERALAPVITRINQRYRQTALDGLERLLAKQGVDLAGADREALERWAETLARRFAHLPTLGLRGLAAEQGMEAVKSFLEACADDSLAELGAAADEPEPESLERGSRP